MQIIFSINDRSCARSAAYSFIDAEKLRRMSVIEEGYEKQVRMAQPCIVGSHAVNGVSALHSDSREVAGARIRCSSGRRSSTTRRTGSRRAAG